MLTTKNKKNSIVKSLALVLALVFAISCCLTACTDKTARADVDALEGTVDTLSKDLDAVKTKVDSNVTEDKMTQAIAAALADYLKTADLNDSVSAMLNDYMKTSDATAFVNGLLADYAKKTDVVAPADIANFITADAVAALLDGYVKKADANQFLADYIGSAEGKAALEEALDGAYMNSEDWALTTAKVMEAYARISEAFDAVDNGTYTAEQQAEIQAICAEYGIDLNDIAETRIEFFIELVRSCTIEELEEAIAGFEALADVETAQDVVDAINEMIDALKADIAATEFGKVTSEYKDQLEAIDAAISAFFDEYAVQAVDEGEFYDGESDKAIVNEAEVAVAGLTNPPATNAAYGINLEDFAIIVDQYNLIMEKADEINEKIAQIVLEVGETGVLNDEATALIEEIKHDDNGTGLIDQFDAINDGIREPINNYSTFEYYEWLYGKTNYEGEKAASMIELNQFAADKAAEYPAGGSEMNVDMVDILDAANAAIEALTYGDFKVSEEAYQAVQDIVDKAKDDMSEVFYKYSLEDFRVESINAIANANATTYADAQYADIVAYGESVIAEIAAVTANEEEEYPYTAAHAEIAEATEDALNVVMPTMKSKVDVKAAVIEYPVAKDLVNDVDFPTVKLATIQAKIDVAVAAQCEAIDALETKAEVDAYEFTAKKALYALYIDCALDQYIQSKQNNVYVLLAAQEGEDWYSDAYALAVQALKALFAVKIDYTTPNAAADIDAYEAAADAELDAKKLAVDDVWTTYEDAVADLVV